MHISGEGRLGLGLALLLGVSAGAAMIWPDYKEIGWVVMAGSAIGLVALAIYHLKELWEKRHAPGGIRVALAFAGMVIFGAGFIGCAVAYFWPNQKQTLTASAQPDRPITQPEKVVLAPAQERLLSLIAGYQRQFAANTLVILRETGGLIFDGNPERGRDISFLQDLYGAKDVAAQTRFGDLMDSMPSEYMTRLPGGRWDDPFVVRVTDAGMKYLAKANILVSGGAQATSSDPVLRDLSNPQLRERVSSLTEQLHLFAAGFQNNETNRFVENWANAVKGTDKNAAFADRTAEGVKRRATFERDFNTRFRAKALALRDEMLTRLGQPLSDADKKWDQPGNVALDYGLLVGPNPVMELADELDKLAAQLPSR